MTLVSRIYIIDKMHFHKSVKNQEYLTKRTLKLKNNYLETIYCDICNIYMCSRMQFEKEYKNKIDNRFFRMIKEKDYIIDTCYEEPKLNNIKLNKISSFEKEHRNHKIEIKELEYQNCKLKFHYCISCNVYAVDDLYYEMISENKKIKLQEKDVYIKLNNENNFDIREKFHQNHQNHSIIKRVVEIDGEKYKIDYCETCDVYLLQSKIFYKHFSSDFKGKLIKDSVIDEKENEKIEFLIKINDFKCSMKNHPIEDICAVVNVFDKKIEEIKQVEINAFYCKFCKVYFIYEREYNKLLKYGIPTCPICEEIKYFSDQAGFETYNEESTLRRFGYNVNAQDDLSALKRQKILSIILENGVMSKNQILSHLSFLYNTKKNQKNMQKALSKWNEDISYVHTYQPKNIRKVEVGAFRKRKRKKYEKL